MHWLCLRNMFSSLGQAGGTRSPQRVSRLRAAMSSNACGKQSLRGVAAFSVAKKARRYCAAGAAALAEAATRQAEAMLSHCCLSVACEYLLCSCNRVCCVALCHLCLNLFGRSVRMRGEVRLSCCKQGQHHDVEEHIAFQVAAGASWWADEVG